MAATNLSHRRCRLLLPVAAAFSLIAVGVRAQQFPGERVGSEYELVRDQETSEKGSNDSTSTSTDRDTLLERVVETRANGLVLEYDLPKNATADDRARSWQFPARLFLPDQGAAQLLNGSDLEARLDKWLKTGKIPRSACGHWIFTWNAFKIECDPNSVLGTIDAFSVRRINLQDGAIYTDARALAPTTLKRTAAGPNSATLVAEMKIDPEKVRRAQAESDVVVAEIMKKPTTLDDALKARAGDLISGTMTITFNVDSTGALRRRVTLTRLQTKRSSGVVEDRTVTETLDRKALH